MAANRVVARFRNGQVIKGSTSDFLPTRDLFHLQTTEDDGRSPVLVVQLADLKALFFVKDFAGDPQHQESNQFPADRQVAGRKLRVTFTDGEILVGITQGYDPKRPGFFLVPADSGSNIERCYVVARSAKAVESFPLAAPSA